MVRTLIFQISNKGSIPFSLSLLVKLVYISFYRINRDFSFLKKKNFIRVINSVIILSFFKNCFNIKKDLKFFIKKKRGLTVTITKSPMANKNFSKEQLYFVYYSIKIIFFINLNDYITVNRLNLLFINSLVINLFLNSGTNMFVLSVIKLKTNFKYNLNILK